MRRAILFLALAYLVSAASALPSGRNTYALRGKTQEIYYLPAEGAAKPEAVLFMPGDAGWTGYAVEMANRIAALGYNVYGFDVKTYLTGFTGTTTLSEAEMAEDLRAIAIWIHAQSGQPVVLAGWSQGANMALLAGSASKNSSFCRGVLAIGLGDRAVLGWRFADNFTYFTKQEPNEPTFSAYEHLRTLSPYPLMMISSSHDEYVSTEVTKSLIDSAREPKRLVTIEAKNHRFSGKRDEFYQAIEDGLEWIHARSAELAGRPR